MTDDDRDDDAVDPKEVERRELTKVAIRLYEPLNEKTERSYEEIAEAIADRSDTWVGHCVREWRNGKHRDLVPDPTKNDAKTHL